MNQQLTIRNYQASDYEILKTMIFGLAQEDIDPEKAYVMPESKILKTVERSISHPDQVQIKIFEIDRTIAGYALLTFYWSNEYDGIVVILDEFYVLPNFRSQGIGSQFIAQLSLNNDYKIIQLEVFKANAKALRLYQKSGFEIVDRHFMNKKL
ncbi:MAG TPA: GNAT family N-acetyltransferase [Flavobacterium sp.]|nr:GNAT family N-acetyltransferase [Flavobacterium sp.]